MAVTVQIPTPLRKVTENKDAVEAEGATVGEVLAGLGEQYPELRSRLYDDQGRLRRFINFFVNGEDIRHGKGEDTPLRDGDEIAIVPAIAGG